MMPDHSADKRKATITKVTTKGKENDGGKGCQKTTPRTKLLVMGVKKTKRAKFPEAARLVQNISCVMEGTRRLGGPITVGVDFKGACNSRSKADLLRECLGAMSRH